MKKNNTPALDYPSCPLCGSDEYLLSGSGSMLCSECGSFFENINLIMTSGTLNIKSAQPIYSGHSVLMH
ncbi:hypothetical protein [Vibrio renipiscarius]|uniref:hypothetical protein n=1 Tax=Vibrio renipiscarius TaxID=1461322 RepID=UPI0009E63BE4|nr:hypothetical protein [Vibrio renipiscarius]